MLRYAPSVGRTPWATPRRTAAMEPVPPLLRPHWLTHPNRGTSYTCSPTESHKFGTALGSAGRGSSLASSVSSPVGVMRSHDRTPTAVSRG